MDKNDIAEMKFIDLSKEDRIDILDRYTLSGFFKYRSS